MMKYILIISLLITCSTARHGRTIKNDERCRSTFRIDFADGEVNHPGGAVWVDNRGVVAEEDDDAEDGWCGRFSGDAHLQIPRFQAAHYGSYFRIVVRIKPTGVNDKLQVLVSNGGGTTAQSVGFFYGRLDTEPEGTVVAAVETTKPDGSFIELKIQPDEWSTLYYQFDGAEGHLYLSDGDETVTDEVIGAIRDQNVNLPLYIGGVSNNAFDAYTGWQGLMDYIEVFDCGI